MEAFESNCALLKNIFSACPTPEDRYKKIISLGETLTAFPDSAKTESNRVLGCQSTLYLHASLFEGKLRLSAWSDALISKGLAAIAVRAFDGLTPEEALLSSPAIFQELGITTSLSPSRANGFANLIIKIKQKSLSFIN